MLITCPDSELGGAELFGCGFFGTLDVEAFGAVVGPVGHFEIGGVRGRVGADDVVFGVALGGGEAGGSDEVAEDGFIEAVGCAC